MKKHISTIIILLAFAYLVCSVYALAKENKELRKLGPCDISGYYLAKTPIIDEFAYIDRSGLIVKESY